MEDVYVVGVGMTPFGRLLDRTVYDMAGEAVALALKDAGCERGDVGSVFYASTTTGSLQGQTAIPGPIAMRRIGIDSMKPRFCHDGFTRSPAADSYFSSSTFQ